MRKSKNTRRILKPWARIFILVVLVFFALLSFCLIYTGKSPNNEKIPSYSYNINKGIDYKVHLKPNDFYEEEFLGENLQYASELIDYINIDFSYLFNGSKSSNFIYRYDVVATIIGEYENTSSGRSELWKKKYTLVQTQDKVKDDSTNFELKQNVKIKYDDYNDVVNRFKTKFRLAIDAYLNVKIKIEYVDNIIENNSTISNEDYMELNIPLNTSTIKIDTNNVKEIKKTVKKEQIVFQDDKKIKIGYSMLAIDILLLALSLPAIFISNKSIYTKELHKIMKGYSEIIVEIENLPSFDNLELLEIKEFDDMVDIEEETKSPILYYETIENSESWFLIIIDKYIYRYILRK